MNLIISGWPGVGETTLGLLLAESLNFKLVQGSQTFRFLGEKLRFGDTGTDRIKADTLLEHNWGHLFERYVATIAKEQQNLVLETDITGFTVKKSPDLISIFLVADKNARQQRLGKDGRIEDIDVLEERDKSLGQIYKKEFDVDFYNLDAIQQHYSLVLNNTSMSIAQELVAVYKLIIDRLSQENQDKLKSLISQAKSREEFYNKEGKQFYIDVLKGRKLLPSSVEIIKDIMKMMPEEVAKLPQELKDILAVL